MFEQPVTLSVLMRFHREMLLPDVERIVIGAVGSAESRLRDEVHALALDDANVTLVKVSERRGTGSEKIVVQMPAGRAYLRVIGHDGAFDANVFYRINVTPLG